MSNQRKKQEKRQGWQGWWQGWQWLWWWARGWPVTWGMGTIRTGWGYRRWRTYNVPWTPSWWGWWQKLGWQGCWVHSWRAGSTKGGHSSSQLSTCQGMHKNSPWLHTDTLSSSKRYLLSWLTQQWSCCQHGRSYWRISTCTSSWCHAMFGLDEIQHIPCWALCLNTERQWNILPQIKKNDLQQFELSKDESVIVQEFCNTLKVGLCGSMFATSHAWATYVFNNSNLNFSFPPRILKNATKFFLWATPNLATIIPAMDHIDIHFMNTIDPDSEFNLAICAAIGLDKRTLNRYYMKTDMVEVYQIAMSMSYFLII